MPVANFKTYCAILVHAHGRGQMFKNYDGVLKVDGEVGNEKIYDLRSCLALGEAGIAERMKRAMSDLRGNGRTMFAS